MKPPLFIGCFVASAFCKKLVRHDVTEHCNFNINIIKIITWLRYDNTRCYFNVRSKANMSQLDLGYRTEPTTKKCKTEKLKSKDEYAQK